MTNLFLEKNFFISLTEARASSDILRDIEVDEKLQVIIAKAEKIVCKITWKNFLFETPLKIKQATILLSENIFLNKNNQRIIKSETRRGNQVVFATENEDFSFLKLNLFLNREIYELLEEFIETNRKVGSSFFRT